MRTSRDLAEANDVVTDVRYTVTVVAINEIGSSAESNSVIYVHEKPGMNSLYTFTHSTCTLYKNLYECSSCLCFLAL